MKEALASILSNTYTVVDARRRINLVQTFIEHARYGEGEAGNPDRLRDFYKKDPAMSADVEAVSVWGKAFFAALNSDAFYKELNEVKGAIEKLPVVTVYVPVEFGEDRVIELGTWCRSHIGPQVLLDTRVDPETIGGCGIAYGSAYQDFSFKHFAEKSRPAITKLVHSYGA